MKILIIGGTRFLGQHLLARLVQRGDDVTIFNRGQTQSSSSFLGVKQIHGDRKICDDLRRAAGQDYDAVIDTVIYEPEEAEQAVDLFSGRTGHYLMVSTANVYKFGRAPLPYRETDTLEDDPRTGYGFKKRQAEDVLFSAWHEQAFPAVCLRMPSVYGPFDYLAREWYFIKRLLDGRLRFLLPDAGIGIFHREYVGNIVEQLLLLISSNATRGEAYNAGHRQFQTCADLLQMAADLLGRTVEIYSVPAARMPWSIALSPAFAFCQSTEKIAALGYREQVDLAVGWERTFNFYRDNPVSNWIQQQRATTGLFDYTLEDRIIDERASLVIPKPLLVVPG